MGSCCSKRRDGPVFSRRNLSSTSTLSCPSARFFPAGLGGTEASLQFPRDNNPVTTSTAAAGTGVVGSNLEESDGSFSLLEHDGWSRWDNGGGGSVGSMDCAAPSLSWDYMEWEAAIAAEPMDVDEQSNYCPPTPPNSFVDEDMPLFPDASTEPWIESEIVGWTLRREHVFRLYAPELQAPATQLYRSKSEGNMFLKEVRVPKATFV